MEQPLAGIKVLEVSKGVPGAFAAKLLADFGAEVVKAEPPDGDPMRHEGPFPGYEGGDIVCYAMGGPLSATGMADREPVKMPANVVLCQSGNVAAVAALAALAVAERSGKGVHVDVSSFETQAGSIDRRTGYLMWRIFTGQNAPRSGGHGAGLIPSGVYPTPDGYVQV